MNPLSNETARLLLALLLVTPALAQNSPRDQGILKGLQAVGEVIDNSKRDRAAAAEAAAQQAAIQKMARSAAGNSALQKHLSRLAAYAPPANLGGRFVLHRQLLADGNSFQPNLSLPTLVHETFGSFFCYNRQMDLLVYVNLEGQIEVIDLSGSVTIGRPAFRRLENGEWFEKVSFNDNQVLITIYKGLRHNYAKESIVLNRRGDLLASAIIPGNVEKVSVESLVVRISPTGELEIIATLYRKKGFVFYRAGKLVSRVPDINASSITSNGCAFVLGSHSPAIAVTYKGSSGDKGPLVEQRWNLETGELLSERQCPKVGSLSTHDPGFIETPPKRSPWTDLMERNIGDDLGINLLRPVAEDDSGKQRSQRKAWKIYKPAPELLLPESGANGSCSAFISEGMPLMAAGFELRRARSSWVLGVDVLDLRTGEVVQRLPGFLRRDHDFVLPRPWASVELKRGNEKGVMNHIWFIETEHDLRHAAALATDDYETAAQYRERVTKLNLTQQIQVSPRGFNAETGLLGLDWRGTTITVASPATEARKLGSHRFFLVRGRIEPVDKNFLELADAMAVLPDGSTIPLRPVPPAPIPTPESAPAASAASGASTGTAASANPPPAPSTNAKPSSDAENSIDILYERLRKLDELRKSGLLTEEEFQVRRKALVKGVP